MSEIRLVVLDIDGVVTGGEAEPLDLDLFARLADMNRASRADPSHPSVTFCTGRPAPYLEVMLQAVDGHLPGVYENGAGIYNPADYRFLPHPELKQSLDGFEQVRTRLAETLVADEKAYFQPGKHHSLTLFAIEPTVTTDLMGATLEALGSLSVAVDLVYSTACLNVLPRGIDKGKGLTLLAEKVEIFLNAMLGVGDSDVDLPFLSLVGYSAAPSNANSRVKELVDYVSPEATADGVRDILANYQLTT